MTFDLGWPWTVLEIGHMILPWSISNIVRYNVAHKGGEIGNQLTTNFPLAVWNFITNDFITNDLEQHNFKVVKISHQILWKAHRIFCSLIQLVRCSQPYLWETPTWIQPMSNKKLAASVIKINIMVTIHNHSTPCPVKKRGHVIFDYNSRISWSIFYNFYTIGNRNEYSTITCNLLT